MQNIQEFFELNNGVVIRSNKIAIQNEIEEIQKNLKLLTIHDDRKTILKNKLMLLENEYDWAKKAEINPSIIKVAFTSNLEGKKLLKG